LGHEVIPLAMQDPGNLPSAYEKYFVSPVEFRNGPAASRIQGVGRAAFGLGTIKAVRALLREERIDAAHVLHAYHQLGMSFMLQLRRRGIPTLLSLHDYKIGCPSYRFFSDADEQICTRCLDHRSGFLWAPAVTRCWNSSVTAGGMLTIEATVNKALGSYRNGPGAVVVLNAMQERAVAAAGVRRERVHRIPHFLDLPPAPHPTDPRRREVLYVGRLVPEKGVAVLIEACARANLPLVIIGGGREEASLRALAASQGTDVTFRGEQDRESVRQAMMTSAVLAVPSVWHEVSPLVVLEAIAAGCPVVGSDVGGMPELIGAGRGVLVPPGAADDWARSLAMIVDQPGLADEVSTNAREFAAREWTRDAWIRRLSDAYVTAGASAL
jgi:glycosyltransferase involved in cell wall biosynthesis